MAQLPNPRRRVTTAAGVPVSGGKLRLYDANTTNLTSVFSDASLSTPLTNPIVADSAGWIPQFFAAEGAIVDETFLSAADVEIGPASVDAVFTGDSSGTISRDFTNSRYQVRGAGGTIHIEAGDPSPDDIGGTMRVGGWNSTTADEIELDADTVTISGDLIVDGGLTVGVTGIDNVVASGTATAQATVDIALPEGLLRYRLEIADLTVSTTATLRALLAFDGVPTFKVGVSDYAYASEQLTSSGSTVSGSTGTTSMNIAAGTSLGSGDYVAGALDIQTPPSATGSIPTIITGVLSMNVSAQMYQARTSGRCGPTYGRATHIRILPSTGNVSFKWRLISGRGFGE